MAAIEGDLQQFMMIVIVFKWFKLFCPSLPIFVCFFGKKSLLDFGIPKSGFGSNLLKR